MRGSFLSEKNYGVVCVEALEDRRLLSAHVAPAPFVDIAVQRVNAPAHAILENGQRVRGQSAAVRIRNGGNVVAAGTVQISFYLSSDQILDGSDILAGVVPARNVHLNPGHSRAFMARLLPPPDLALGRYYLFAVATPGGGITQGNAIDRVGIATRQVLVIEPRFRMHGFGLQDCCNDFYDGTAIDLFTAETIFEAATPPPASQPGDSGSTSEPATNPAAPTSQPSGDPTTAPPDYPVSQPTTQPGDDGSSDNGSSGGSSDSGSDGSDDDGGGDGGGGDDGGGDDD